MSDCSIIACGVPPAALSVRSWAIQQALTQAEFDGWLFYDFHHRDPMAYSNLGLDPGHMTTRRWLIAL